MRCGAEPIDHRPREELNETWMVFRLEARNASPARSSFISISIAVFCMQKRWYTINNMLLSLTGSAGVRTTVGDDSLMVVVRLGLKSALYPLLPVLGWLLPALGFTRY